MSRVTLSQIPANFSGAGPWRSSDIVLFPGFHFAVVVSKYDAALGHQWSYSLHDSETAAVEAIRQGKNGGRCDCIEKSGREFILSNGRLVEDFI